MKKEEADKIREIPILFILGKGRSGTTLLQSLLNSHPNIVAPPESKFIVLLAARFGNKKRWTRKDVCNFADALYTEFLFFTLWKPDKQELIDYLLSALEYLDYRLACKMVYYHTKGNKEEIVLISDKNPLYALFIPELLLLFPDAKFIHLVRNPFDNLLSTKKSLGGRNVPFIVLQWLRHNQMIEDAKKEMPDRFYTLLYENMVKNPEDSLKGICGFINVPFSENMKSVNKEEIKETYSHEPELFEKSKKTLMNPVSTVSIGKWQQELTESEQMMVEAIAGEYAREKYNYVTVLSGNRKVSRPRIEFWRFVHCVWYHFTRFRYKNYNFNRVYSRFKKLIFGNKMAVWETVIKRNIT